MAYEMLSNVFISCFYINEFVNDMPVTIKFSKIGNTNLSLIGIQGSIIQSRNLITSWEYWWMLWTALKLFLIHR